MNSRLVLPVGSLVLALALLLSTPMTTSAHDAPPARVAAVSAPAPAILLANWSSILQNRARMMQLAFVAILLGMFILRWGGK